MDSPFLILFATGACFVMGVLFGVTIGAGIAPHDCEMLGKFSRNNVVYACALEKK